MPCGWAQSVYIPLLLMGLIYTKRGLHQSNIKAPRHFIYCIYNSKKTQVVYWSVPGNHTKLLITLLIILLWRAKLPAVNSVICLLYELCSLGECLYFSVILPSRNCSSMTVKDRLLKVKGGRLKPQLTFSTCCHPKADTRHWKIMVSVLLGGLVITTIAI